jgi:hypothetical protein
VINKNWEDQSRNFKFRPIAFSRIHPSSKIPYNSTAETFPVHTHPLVPLQMKVVNATDVSSKVFPSVSSIPIASIVHLLSERGQTENAILGLSMVCLKRLGVFELPSLGHYFRHAMQSLFAFLFSFCVIVRMWLRGCCVLHCAVIQLCIDWTSQVERYCDSNKMMWP